MGQGGKQAKTNVFANLKYIFGVLGVKYFKLHLNRSKLFFSVSTPCLPLVAEAPPTESNNHGGPSMRCRIDLAQHSFFDIHGGMVCCVR